MTTANQHTGTPLPEAGIQRGGHRRHQYPRRTKQVVVRLSTDEYDTLAAAAARVELTPTGYAAEAALAAARDQTTPTASDADHGDATAGGPAVTRAELAHLQRELFAARTAVAKVGTNLNQAATVLNALGRPPAWLDDAVARCQRTLNDLDTAAATIDGRLR